MATLVNDNVDYRLLNNLSHLVICSSCLRGGKVTPVPQIISRHRRLTNVCPECRQSQRPSGGGRKPGKVLQFPKR